MNTTFEGFTTLDEVKDALGITDTNSDSFLGALISNVTSQVQTDTGRDLIKATYTEYFNGDFNNQALTLKEYPVASITSVHDDTERGYNSDDLIAATEYTVETDTGILRFDSQLQRGRQNIKVIYVAGYDPLPNDLKLAVIKLVMAEYKSIRVLVNTTREGADVVEKTVTRLREEADKVIMKYKRVPSA